MAMSMRERIARKIHGVMSDLPWDSLYPVGRADYLDAADAVLTELEKPTEGMFTAAYDANGGKWCDDEYEPAPKDCWAAMIRAAKEGK